MINIEILKSFFLQWKISISKTSVCYTRNKLITSYIKKLFFSDTPKATCLSLGSDYLPRHSITWTMHKLEPKYQKLSHEYSFHGPQQMSLFWKKNSKNYMFWPKVVMSLTSSSTLLRFASRVPLVLIDDTNFTWWRYEQRLCDMTSFPEGESRRQMITWLFSLKYLGNACLFFFPCQPCYAKKMR